MFRNKIVSNKGFSRYPAGNYMFKVNNRNTRTTGQLFS